MFISSQHVLEYLNKIYLIIVGWGCLSSVEHGRAGNGVLSVWFV
jgi:hypothetical protein